jgi:DNA-binding MarR family transcriptional regulator
VDLDEYFKAHPDELLKGVLIAGSIGSGKTQRAMKLVKTALDIGYGVLVFDPATDYQRLLAEHPSGVVIDFSEYYLNPLEPPGDMPLEDWAPTFIQVFAQNFGLKDPSIAILQKCMNHLVQETKEKDGEPPILEELLDEVYQYSPRRRSSETSSHVSVQNRLESTLDSEWSRCLNVRRGFQPDDFAEGLLVIQMRPVGIERVHELVVSMTIAKLFAYRSWLMATKNRTGKDMLIVIEEAHRFLREGRQGDRYGQRLYSERALVESRKLGMGFMVIDQMPHRVSSYVLGSCNVWLINKLMDASSRRMIGDVLCMEQMWSRSAMMELPLGSTMVRVADMKQLEKASPLLLEIDTPLGRYEMQNLPAILAAPLDESELLGRLPQGELEKKMWKNPRYRRYFERNIRQDADRIRPELTPEWRAFLDRFVKHITSTEKRHWKEYTSFIQEITSQSKEVPVLDKFQIEELKDMMSILTSPLCFRTLRCLMQDEMDISNLIVKTGKSQSWISRLLVRMVRIELIENLGKFGGRAAKFKLTMKGRKVIQWSERVTRMMDGRDLVVVQESVLSWLLTCLQKEIQIVDNSLVAGIKGNPNLKEEAIALDLLIRYLLDTSQTELQLSHRTFKALMTGLKNGVLAELLKKKKPMKLENLIKLSSLGSRGLRRQLEILEQIGVVERIWHNQKRGARLNQRWRNSLKNALDKNIRFSFIQRGVFLRLIWFASIAHLLECMEDSAILDKERTDIFQRIESAIHTTVI